MGKNKSEFAEAMADMSRLAGALAGAAVVAGKRMISYVNKLTLGEDSLKSPAEGSASDRKTKAGND
jgi:hypothetical protein